MAASGLSRGLSRGLDSVFDTLGTLTNFPRCPGDQTGEVTGRGVVLLSQWVGLGTVSKMLTFLREGGSGGAMVLAAKLHLELQDFL